MKKFISWKRATIILVTLMTAALLAVGISSAVASKESTQTGASNTIDEFPTCPAELSYVETPEGLLVRVTKGLISDFMKDAGTREWHKKMSEDNDTPLDFNKCPPSPGTMSYPIPGFGGMVKGQIDIPMGFFDNPDNYLNENEYEEFLEPQENPDESGGLQKVGGD